MISMKFLMRLNLGIIRVGFIKDNTDLRRNAPKQDVCCSGSKCPISIVGHVTICGEDGKRCLICNMCIARIIVIKGWLSTCTKPKHLNTNIDVKSRCIYVEIKDDKIKPTVTIPSTRAKRIYCDVKPWPPAKPMFNPSLEMLKKNIKVRKDAD